DARTERGDLLDVRGSDVHHLVHRVRHHAHQGVLTLHLPFDDDDATGLGYRPLSYAELDSKVYHRHDASAQVDDPPDPLRCFWHRSNRVILNDLLCLEDADRIFFTGQEKRKILLLFHYFSFSRRRRHVISP